jgi:hypothetical protein
MQMKRFSRFFRPLPVCLLLHALVPTQPLAAQDFEGIWQGTTLLAEEPLSLVFHLTKVGSLWQGSFDCPNQGAFALSISAIERPTTDSIVIQLPTINALFAGKLRDESIRGVFFQGKHSARLTLTKLTPSKSNK